MPGEAKVIPLHPCAACGAPTEGGYSIHRDGFGEGPEVRICDACGANETPTLEELWARIADRRATPRRPAR